MNVSYQNRSIRRSGLLGLVVFAGMGVGATADVPPAPQSTTGAAATRAFGGPPATGTAHPNATAATADIAGQIEHHFTVQRNNSSIANFNANYRQATKEVQAEAARLGSRVCKPYTGVREFDGPGGSLVRAELKPASPPGPVLSQGRPDSRPATPAEEQAALERGKNTERRTRDICADPPARPAPTPAPSRLDLGSNIRTAPARAWRPGMALPPLPSLRTSSLAGGPSLSGPARGVWDSSRYSLGVDTRSIGTSSAAWAQTMVEKHPWLGAPAAAPAAPRPDVARRP